MRRYPLVYLAVCLFLQGCMSNWARIEDEDFRVFIEETISYGPIEGFLQTPQGGGVGTTDYKRPTFKELDIERALVTDTLFSVGGGAHALYAGKRAMHFSSENVLDETLLSHTTTFPAGSLVEANVKLDLYRIGYQHRFRYGNDRGGSFGIYPEVELDLLGFTYKLNGPGGLSASREYDHGTISLGLESEWSPGGRFSVSGGISRSLVNNLSIFSSHLTGNYHLWGTPDRGATAVLGVGYDLIDFEDDQILPNHIRAETGPMVLVGIKVDF